MRIVRVIDLFCGIGGNSWGAQSAGAEVVAGFDKWELAGRVYKANFSQSRFIPGDLSRFKQAEIFGFKQQLGPIDLILASPECTSHSPARGAKESDSKSLRLSWEVWRFARIFLPRFVVLENVPAMQKWSSYSRFLQEMQRLGYKMREQLLDAANFGVPQTRKRLYILFDRQQVPPEVQARTLTPIPIESYLSANGTYPFSPLHKPGRAQKTLARAERAMQVLGEKTPFLMVYYGSGPQWQTLDAPLRTVTTHDRFALVRPDGKGEHEMRMLQPEELKAAMGFPPEFSLEACPTRNEKIHLLGNAVCPPVMQAIVETLMSE
jgi:DNA (cytosine-5)-methyltransferase 1